MCPRRFAPIGLFLASLVAAESPPGTLLENGSFDASLGISGWSVDLATVDPNETPLFTWSATDSPIFNCPASGFAEGRLESILNSAAIDLVSHCVPVGGLEAVRIRYSGSVGGDFGANIIKLRLVSYSGASCDSEQLITSTEVSTVVSPWNNVDLGDLALPPTTSAVRLVFHLQGVICSLGCFVAVQFDNVILSSPSLLFSDGFEGGADCRW